MLGMSLDTIMIPLQAIVFLYSIAYHLLSIPGFFPIRAHLLEKARFSFAVIVPAHNEAKVIGPLLESLERQNYPKELYQIFVISDNCSDNTSSIAHEHDAIVYERFDKTKRSKGHALSWFFELLWQRPEDYDAVIVFDADNLVHADFLLQMNDHMAGGEKIIQGYIESKNPEDSWIASAFSIGFWVANRLLQLSRYNWGVSTTLFGTGMCIATDVLQEIGWSTKTLTEDLEYSMEAILRGYKITWAHEAITYDERATGLGSCWNQQLRWQQGRLEVMMNYAWPMLKGCLRGDADKLEAALNLFYPVFLLLSGLLGLFSGLNTLFPAVTGLNYTHILPIQTFTALAVIQLVASVAIMLLDHRPKRFLKLAPYYLLYMTFWVPVTIAAVLQFRNRRWTHTRHQSDVRIEEMELRIKS